MKNRVTSKLPKAWSASMAFAFFLSSLVVPLFAVDAAAQEPRWLTEEPDRDRAEVAILLDQLLVAPLADRAKH